MLRVVVPHGQLLTIKAMPAHSNAESKEHKGKTAPLRANALAVFCPQKRRSTKKKKRRLGIRVLRKFDGRNSDGHWCSDGSWHTPRTGRRRGAPYTRYENRTSARTKNTVRSNNHNCAIIHDHGVSIEFNHSKEIIQGILR